MRVFRIVNVRGKPAPAGHDRVSGCCPVRARDHRDGGARRRFPPLMLDPVDFVGRIVRTWNGRLRASRVRRKAELTDQRPNAADQFELTSRTITPDRSSTATSLLAARTP